ncbi:MAG: hypothetical protein QNK89_08120 [Lacinutrix sp.]|uniref:hypothetical protein n=1 Tax=Lacinutrix sp. TaxID=1937692 RepID=UPI0030B0859C
MKKLIFVFTLFIATTIFVNAQDWINYNSQDLAFVANFPEEPKRTVQDVETALGALKMHMIMHTPTSGDHNIVYSVIRLDYPESQFKDADDEYNTNVLDGAVSGAVKNINGTLIFDNKIRLNGYPGRSIKIEVNEGLFS